MVMVINKIILSALVSTVFAGKYWQQKSPGNIAEVLNKAGATTLVELVVKAGLAETLSDPGPFTVFAPVNGAFAKLPKDLVDTLTSDVDLLKKVLLYHVVPGAVTSKDITDDLMATSAEGSDLRANIFTRYGREFITINGKSVQYPDIQASNGIIHFMKDVIYPIPSGSIADVVSGDERFSTLLATVGAAGLANTLATGGPFTVFAPTNEAFAKVPQDALNGLLADKEALTKVLLRHVVPGTKFANALVTQRTLETAGGSAEDNIAIASYRSGTLKVSTNEKQNVAKVIDTDIIATNGVIHAIDTVI